MYQPSTSHYLYFQDHFDKRENLGDCFVDAIENGSDDNGKDIQGFLNSFGFG